MNTKHMPPNWTPKAWPETVVYQGMNYTFNTFIGENGDIAHYCNPNNGWATSENPFFMRCLWQQSQEGK